MGKYAHMIVVLSAIALLSGLALGGLDALTRDRIRDNVLRYKKIPAVAEIYEGVAGTLDEQSRAAVEEELLAEKKYVNLGGKEPTLLFLIKKGGEPYAVALEGFGSGFGGDLGVMAGIKLDAEALAGIGITTLSETPGVGSRVTEESFTLQFRDMPAASVFKVKKDGGDIDAVTGATISSRAVAEAVDKAVTFFKAHREQILEALGR